MSQLVYMPVKCIDKFCEHCEELEIDVDGTNFYGMNGNDLGRENHIYCVHWKQCTAIENKIRDEMNKKMDFILGDS